MIIFGQNFAIPAIVQSICMTMLDYYLLIVHDRKQVSVSGTETKVQFVSKFGFRGPYTMEKIPHTIGY